MSKNLNLLLNISSILHDPKETIIEPIKDFKNNIQILINKVIVITGGLGYVGGRLTEFFVKIKITWFIH